jgi:VWFA-related protein
MVRTAWEMGGRSSRFASAAEAIAAAILLFFMAAPAARGQGADEHPNPAAIKSTSTAVNVYAIVEGRRGELIHGLAKDDFELTENTLPQEIRNFSPDTNGALSLGVTIDTSLSQEHLLSTEQEAAKKFLRSVLQSDDRAFVMNFDVDVKLLQDFTNAPAELVKAVDSARINETGKSVLSPNAPPAGGTHLYDAVYLASSELMKSRIGRKVLVLVTDGEDQGSKIGLDASIESAEKSDVIVYSIVVSDAEFYTLMGANYHGDSSVRKLARQTGGRTIRVKSAGEVGSAFDAIARELRAQYLLGYFPKNLSGDGSFRTIRVRVRGHNYAVRARAGYYDQGPVEAKTSDTR